MKKKFDPSVGGWKYNRKEPVGVTGYVELRCRDGKHEICSADGVSWNKTGGPYDVIWWRKAKSPKKPKESPHEDGYWQKPAGQEYAQIPGDTCVTLTEKGAEATSGVNWRLIGQFLAFAAVIGAIVGGYYALT